MMCPALRAVGQVADFSFRVLGAAALALNRKLSLPVSRMWQWWVSRSSSAVVILASPNTPAGVAAGYAKAGRDRIEKDPDQRVQDASKLVFSKFAEFQSVRQVHIWLRDEGIALPVKSHKAGEGRGIVWKLPLYNTVHNILTNPVYAGAYAF